MLSDLPFPDSCGRVRTAIPPVYDAWKRINRVPIYDFARNELLLNARLDRLMENATLAERVLSNTHELLNIAADLGLLNADEQWELGQALNSTRSNTTDQFDQIPGLFTMWNLTIGFWEERGEPLSGFHRSCHR